ncbi:MAG: hypothetical protein Q9160_009111 [Pyrenula sp. 1 TL-2023]
MHRRPLAQDPCFLYHSIVIDLSSSDVGDLILSDAPSAADVPVKGILGLCSTSRTQTPTRSTAQNFASISEYGDLFAVSWPAPLQNVLLVKKECSSTVTDALIEYAKYVPFAVRLTRLTSSRHLKDNYSNLNILMEPQTASETSKAFQFPIFTTNDAVAHNSLLHLKTDFVTTFGGDGTILHAASLFATSHNVPPILSFSMGTLGFLGEWKFAEYKRAFREVYTAGLAIQDRPKLNRDNAVEADADSSRWSSVQGKSMGSTRGARVLIRNRLKVGVFAADGTPIRASRTTKSHHNDLHAMNEVIIHRGKDPHLAIVEVYVGGRFLTEAVADGMIISTPTGSTAYSLSSGGSIVHPLVSSVLLTPICPRSLSFRPLVLPASTSVTLRISEKNRSRELEVSIDGVRRSHGIAVGTEVKVVGEEVRQTRNFWEGGIPCVMRGAGGVGNRDDGWVGGLNGLLKFNYPLGEES